MGATFSRVKNWVTEVLSYADLNAEIDNILTYFTPAGMDDYSTNATEMRVQTSPGAVGTESLAQSLAQELARLRYVIARMCGTTYWYTDPGISLTTLGATVSNMSSNRISSGRARSDSSQLIALVPHGTLPRVTLKGATTPFVYYISGTAYTISSDVNLTLSVAPSSNNTALTNPAGTGATATNFANTFPQLKYTGEFGTKMEFDTAGTEINTRNNVFSAFKVNNGVTNEYFVGTPVFDSGSSTAGRFVGCKRGFFFDSADAPIPRLSVDNNRTVTLMKLAYIFAKTDGTLTMTYNPLKVQGSEPASPTAGDYWYDTTNSVWKIYSGSWASAGATFIGWAICDSSGCIGARTFNILAAPKADNTIKLQAQTNSIVVATADGQKINVNGRDIEYVGARPVWDMASDLESGVTETASTLYFLYVTEYGNTKISDLGPYERPELYGYYHPYHNWRCVGQVYNDSSSAFHSLLSYSNPDAHSVSNSVSGNAATILLHSHPGKSWGLNEMGVSGRVHETVEDVRVPFLMQITIPSGAVMGQSSTNSLLYMYLCHSGGFPDIGLIAKPYEEYIAATVIDTGSDEDNEFYTNIALSGEYAKVPVATLDYTAGTPGTWSAAFEVMLRPGGFPVALPEYLGTPVGMVSAYAGTTAPVGWLLCDGTAVSRATYAALFAVIGETHGEGDNSTTFHLPDYRGRFLRGRDGGAARDPDAATRTAMNTNGATGDNVGSVQGSANLAHTHTMALRLDEGAGNWPNSSPTTAGGTGTTDSSGGTEARPINAYVNYIIKT